MRLKLQGPDEHYDDPVSLVGHNIRVWLDNEQRTDVRGVDVHFHIGDLVTATIEVNVTELEVDCNVREANEQHTGKPSSREVVAYRWRFGPADHWFIGLKPPDDAWEVAQLGVIEPIGILADDHEARHL